MIDVFFLDDGVTDFLLIGADNFWLKPASWWAMAQVLLGLGMVIFVHELGHFLVAKACGVKCDKFYVGFDAFDIKVGDRVIVPRSLVKFQWGETEYGIGILPLGGYVKMLGQDDNPGNIEKEIERSKLNVDEESQAALVKTGLIDRDNIDPRSFLAKSVLQRMAIISAGVIFNLIFAVLFAMYAFKSGVNFEPAMIGNVIGGGPAWEADLAGADIKRLGSKTTEGYYTRMDLFQDIVFHGNEAPLEIEYIPYGKTAAEVTEITPRKGMLRDNKDLAFVGIMGRTTPKIGEAGAIEGNAAAKADPKILPGDLIVEVNSTPIKTDIDLRHVLARDSDKVAQFVMERITGTGVAAKTETIRTQVDRNPMRTVGFAATWLPIAAIKRGSPAAISGLKVGDEIISINGQPRGDLMTLEVRLIQLARAGQSVQLEIKRDGTSQPISIQPMVPHLLSDLEGNQPVPIDSLGVAIPMSPIIEAILPGSPAAAAGLQVGDEIVAMKYLLTPEQLKNDMFKNVNKKAINLLADETMWAELYDQLQFMEPGTELELSLKRNGNESTARLKTEASDTYFLDSRGVALTVLQHHYQSESWGDAFKYGYQQVIKDIQRVGLTLAKLVKGKISPTNLGGPGTIALAATSEASQGTSRLLLFLTFLSANLAVVNFLPIPILDGGHMLFLAYEGIFRRPVTEKVQVILTYAGLAMILALMLFVISLDIGRISNMLL